MKRVRACVRKRREEERIAMVHWGDEWEVAVEKKGLKVVVANFSGHGSQWPQLILGVLKGEST